MPTAKYNEPPVNEVVMGVTFVPIVGFHTQHIGRFWEKIADKYPKSEQAANYGEPLQLDKGEIYPGPRFWFISDTRDKLVQIQRNLFLCNWRKVDGEGIYPEYDEMKKVFKENYDSFLKYLRKLGFNDPVHTDCQFNYINHFLEGKEWKIGSDITKIIPSFGYPMTDEAEGPKNYDLNYVYDLPDRNRGDFRMKFTTAKLVSSEQKVIIFENSARGLDSDSDDIYEWFDYAHEQLVNKFESVTSQKIQTTVWKKQ